MQQVSVLETNIGSSTTGNSSNTQVIFNDAGTLRGDAGLTYNAATDTLSTGSATISGDLTVATSALKVTGGKVGIGTASPAYELDVSSATASNQLRISGSNQNSITFANAAGGASNGFLMGRSFSSDDANNFFVFDLATSALRLFIGNTGNVGIATPAPSYRLSVNASNPTSGNIAQFYNDATSSLNGAFCLITQFGVQDWYMGQPAGVSAFTIGTGTTSKSEFFRIDGGGNVGVGVTPSAWGAGLKALQVGARGYGSFFDFNNDIIGLTSNLFWTGSAYSRISASSKYAVAYYHDIGNGAHQWLTSSAAGTNGVTPTMNTNMTLDGSGNLLVGTTSALSAWATRLTLSTDAGTTKWAVGPYAATTNFIISASGSFGVYLNGTSAVSWTGISDERLKDIIEPISNAVSKVGSLRAVIGKFKADETNTRRSFLLAQDVQAVLPEAVDASNPDRLGVAYTDVIPLLVAAIKELSAEVNALKNA
jgi:hypothetical protein